jgi:hypothetical protein
MKALKQGRDPGSEGRHFAAKPRFRAKQVMAAAALLLILLHSRAAGAENGLNSGAAGVWVWPAPA